MLNVSHKYVVNDALYWASGFNATYVSFYTNGMYDPEVAAGGHQPLYFDQLSALYDHYVVQSCKIEVEFSGKTNEPVCVGVALDDDGSLAYTNLGALCEQPGTTFKNLTNSDTVKFTRWWNLKTAFGAGSDVASQYRGTPSANPTETQAFAIFARPIDVTASATYVPYTVTLTYNATWKELKEQQGS